MKIKSIITAALALLVSTACSGGSKQEKVMAKDGKALVVFFSHAGDNYAVGNIEVGNTKIVADYITEVTGAEQFEIVTHKYDGMAYTTHQSGKGRDQERRTARVRGRRRFE